MLGDYLSAKGVSLERLLSLCAVAEEGGVIAAAGGDPTRQSLISKQVRELEEALGVVLLDRRVRPRVLTPAGEDLMCCFREFAGNFENRIRNEKGRGEIVRVGAGESVILWLLIPWFSKMRDAVSLQFEFSKMQSREALEAVASGRVDLAFHSGKHERKDLESREVRNYGMRLVAKPGVLAGRGMISWSKLPVIPLVFLAGRGEVASLVENLAAGYPDGPVPWMRCTSHQQVLEVCLERKVVGLVPELAARRARGLGLEVRRLRELNDWSYQLVVSWKKESFRGDGPGFLTRFVF